MARSLLHLRLRKTPTPDTHEKLERFKRYPQLLAKWAGRVVYIWSAEHHAFWRPEGAGYTSKVEQAWKLTFERAMEWTNHCGPEKQIEFKSIEHTFPA